MQGEIAFRATLFRQLSRLKKYCYLEELCINGTEKKTFYMLRLSTARVHMCRDLAWPPGEPLV